MDDKKRGNIILGAVLIVVGVVLIAMNLFEDTSEAVILFLVGSAFVAWYSTLFYHTLLSDSI